MIQTAEAILVQKKYFSSCRSKSTAFWFFSLGGFCVFPNPPRHQLFISHRVCKISICLPTSTVGRSEHSLPICPLLFRLAFRFSTKTKPIDPEAIPRASVRVLFSPDWMSCWWLDEDFGLASVSLSRFLHFEISRPKVDFMCQFLSVPRSRL